MKCKLNNKGMTTVEILVTFLIVAVIVVSLYNGVVALKDKETISSYKLSLVTYRDLLTKDIQDDLIKVGLAGAEISSMSGGTGYRVTFTLRDGSKRILEVKQVFGCNAVDTVEEDELCVKAGIAKDASDSFSISYGLPGDVIEYPLPNLGNEEIPNLHNNGTHTISALRINEVDISTANRVFSLRITLYHPDLGSRYSIDIVSPINFPGGGINQEVSNSNLGVPVAVVRLNNSTGATWSSGNWTKESLWFGEFSAASAVPIARYEYSENCTGKVTGVLNTSGVVYNAPQNTSRCIRAVDINGKTSGWSLPYYFRIDKLPPQVFITTPTVDNSKDIVGGTCYVKENGRGNKYNCFYRDVDLTGTASDSLSGIKSKGISCSAVTNQGKKWNVKTKKINDSKLKVIANVPKEELSVEKVTCTFTASDVAGNSESVSTSFYMGNGWWLHPGGDKGGDGWYYFANGEQLLGWQNIYWYNNSVNSAGQFDWYYFYDGTESNAINGCSGPKYEMARGWCKEIGGYHGWYYFRYGTSQQVNNNRWFPDGSMFFNGTFTIDGSSYNFNSSGRCIQGNGCY